MIPKAVADIEKGIILAVADISMSPERVFSALTVPAEIEYWWGADDVYHMTDWKQDFRVGGGYTVNVRRPEGNILPASGKFLVIDPSHQLVHTRKYEWDFPVLGRRETTIAYRLDRIASGTRVTVRHEGFLDCSDAAYEHAAGWERVLGWLEDYGSHYLL